MKQEVTNFGRFYVLLKLMPGGQNPDELKEEFVWKFTHFRTSSLREIRWSGYNRISSAKMREIYNSWLMKQRVKKYVDRVADEELIRYGYLEKGDKL